MIGPSGKIGKTDGEYSVCQFFDNDMHEYTRRWVSLEEAMEAFKHYSNSIAARHGIVVKVIITDGGDYTNAMWEYGKGLVYPTPEMLREHREGK